MGNSGCKSCNVHPNGSDGKLICEKNDKTRQMKPGDFERKKGSMYFSSVQVRGKLKVWFKVCIFSIMLHRFSLIFQSKQ